MLSLSPGKLSVEDFYVLLANSIGPRPIALASTISEMGKPNLSPFSHYNFFGVNPPIIVFSPMQRLDLAVGRDTLDNIEENREVVLNVVNYDMIQQATLAGMNYGENINEFDKAGLTMLDSEEVKPKRVAESPVQFECKVNDIICTGKDPGSGNLMICEVVKIHISELVLFEEDKIDPYRLDLVGKMAEGWFSRTKKGMFKVDEPADSVGIGVDKLPKPIKNSSILTGNDLGKLGNVEKQPGTQEIEYFVEENDLEEFINDSSIEKIHAIAQEYLRKNDVKGAWKILLAKH